MIRAILITLVLGATAPAYSDEARELVEGFHAALTSLSVQPAADFAARCDALAPVLDSTHDLQFIARLTLGYHWSQLEQEQQDAFVAQFRQLSLATYAARFGALNGKRFTIVETLEQPRGRRLVRAQLELPDRDPLSFDYVLHETGDGWRIVNILVDGVSDLALKRAEYTTQLADSGFDGLLALLERQAETQRQGD